MLLKAMKMIYFKPGQMIPIQMIPNERTELLATRNFESVSQIWLSKQYVKWIHGGLGLQHILAAYRT